MRHHELSAGGSAVQLDVPAVGRPVLRIIDHGTAASAALTRPDAAALRDWLNEWLGDSTVPGPTS